MKMSDARKAMGFFPEASPRQRARQAVAWARAVELLGDKRITSVKVQRLEKPFDAWIPPPPA
jgi:hypothetical protein